jgi:NlpC/P60 family putative phage cell wall peptidase
MPQTDTRTRIVALARTWLGTPYHNQASLKGVGTDCVGLVRGIWRELYGSDAEATPAYTPDWAEASGRETLIEAARRHLVEIPRFQAEPGDVLVFRWRRHTLAKHCAILTAPAAMIHALEGAPVTEVAVTPWWRRHLAAAFAFPEALHLPVLHGERVGACPRARPEGEGPPPARASKSPRPVHFRDAPSAMLSFPVACGAHRPAGLGSPLEREHAAEEPGDGRAVAAVGNRSGGEAASQ